MTTTPSALALFEPEKRPIPGFPGYLATELGEVIGKRGRALSPRAHHRTGHLRVRLYGRHLDPVKCKRNRGKGVVNSRHRDVYVHVLVCLAFHGAPPDECPIVLHGDGDPTNNAPTNLRWGTYVENAEDARVHALEREAMAALDQDDATYEAPPEGAEVPF